MDSDIPTSYDGRNMKERKEQSILEAQERLTHLKVRFEQLRTAVLRTRNEISEIEIFLERQSDDQ